MSDKFHLQYELHRAGWATASIRHGDVSVDMAASYLHDSLRELAGAAYSMSRGSMESRVVFMDEPGEHQVTFSRVDAGDVRYSITWYNDWESWGIRRLPGSRHVCEGTISTRRLAQQVYSAMWAIYETYRESGYKSRWSSHDFPLQEMKWLAET